MTRNWARPWPSLDSRGQTARRHYRGEQLTAVAYLNASLAIEDRVNDLIDLMELDEKVAQLGAVEFPD